MSEDDRLIAGRYRLLEHIGRGAMGVVWRAHDEALDRTVAVKELAPYAGLDSAGAEQANRRVMREGRIAAQLQHPNAITVYSVVEDDDKPWLVMEYLSSRSLETVLTDRGTLSPDEVARIGTQLAAALAAAHAAGIVHRDVKPSNVLIAEDGTAKLTDFGISRTIGDGTMTATGDIAGTPGFFAPEVARGEQATFASDVFALGATLYNALEGAPPFGSADNQIALLYKAANGEITPPSNAGPLEPVLLRMLHRPPNERPVMPTVRQELTAAPADAAKNAAPAAAPPPQTMVAAQPPAEHGSSRRMLFGSVAAAVLVIAGTLAVILAVTGQDTLPARVAETSPNPHVTQGAAIDATPSNDTPSSTADAEPSSTTSQPTSSTTTTTSRTTTSTTSSAPAQSPTDTILSYYALMPGNPQAGYAKLTEHFKQARGTTFQQYRDFWSQFADVRVSNVAAQGKHRVSATVTYVYPSGNTETEQHVYTLVRSGDGWAINGQQFQ